MGEIMKDFINDMKEIIKRRNISSRDGIIAVLDETDQKWRSFAQAVKCRSDGFVEYTRLYNPSLARMWGKLPTEINGKIMSVRVK